MAFCDVGPSGMQRDASGDQIRTSRWRFASATWIATIVGVLAVGARTVHADPQSQCPQPPNTADVNQLLAAASEDDRIADAMNDVMNECARGGYQCKTAQQACQAATGPQYHGQLHDESAFMQRITSSWLGQTYKISDKTVLVDLDTYDTSMICHPTAADLQPTTAGGTSRIQRAIAGRRKIAAHHRAVVQEYLGWRVWANGVTVQCANKVIQQSGQNHSEGQGQQGQGQQGQGQQTAQGQQTQQGQQGQGQQQASQQQQQQAKQQQEQRRQQQEQQRQQQEQQRREEERREAERQRQARIAARRAAVERFHRLRAQADAENDRRIRGEVNAAATLMQLKGGSAPRDNATHLFRIDLGVGITMWPVMSNSSGPDFAPASKQNSGGGFGFDIGLEYWPIFWHHFGLGIFGAAKSGGFATPGGATYGVQGGGGARAYLGDRAGLSLLGEAGAFGSMVGTSGEYINTTVAGSGTDTLRRLGAGAAYCISSEKKARTVCDTRIAAELVRDFTSIKIPTATGTSTTSGDGTFVRLLFDMDTDAIGRFGISIDAGSYPAPGDTQYPIDAGDQDRTGTYFSVVGHKAWDWYGGRAGSTGGGALSHPLLFDTGAAALLGGALGFDLWADSAYGDAKAEMSSQSRRDSLYSSANSRRHIAIGLAAAGVGCAALAVWSYLHHGHHDRPKATARRHLAMSPTGVAVVGTF